MRAGRAWRAAAGALAAGTLAAVGPAGCGGSTGGAGRPTVDLAGVVPAEETTDDGALTHLAYVLTEDQQVEFRSLPSEQRAEWLRIRWAELDPTPTTPENERRIAHYRRLAYAREHFARDREPGWDARGQLLLRYGPPDERRTIPGDVVPGLGLVPPKEIWVYRWLDAAFELEDARFQGDFVDGIAERRTNRPDMEVGITALGVDQEIPAAAGRPTRETAMQRVREDFGPVDAEVAAAQERLARMMERGQETLHDRPRMYRHDFGGGKLDVVFDVQCFADRESGRTRVLVSTAMWAKDLRFRAEGDGREAVWEVQLALQTRDYHDVARTQRFARDRKTLEEDLSGRLVLDQTALLVDPGSYRLALSVQDSVSRNAGVFRTEVTVPAFPEGVLALSDVQRAVDVRPARPGDAFVREGLQVVPYPPGTYPADRDIHLFFEIYGLALSPTGDALYTVTFTIRPRSTGRSSWFGSSKGRLIPGVATSYDGRARSPTAREYFALDPKTFDDGVYDVEIRVTDRVADAAVSRAAAFAVTRD